MSRSRSTLPKGFALSDAKDDLGDGGKERRRRERGGKSGKEKSGVAAPADGTESESASGELTPTSATKRHKYKNRKGATDSPGRGSSASPQPGSSSSASRHRRRDKDGKSTKARADSDVKRHSSEPLMDVKAGKTLPKGFHLHGSAGAAAEADGQKRHRHRRSKSNDGDVASAGSEGKMERAHSSKRSKRHRRDASESGSGDSISGEGRRHKHKSHRHGERSSKRRSASATPMVGNNGDVHDDDDDDDDDSAASSNESAASASHSSEHDGESEENDTVAPLKRANSSQSKVGASATSPRDKKMFTLPKGFQMPRFGIGRKSDDGKKDDKDKKDTANSGSANSKGSSGGSGKATPGAPASFADRAARMQTLPKGFQMGKAAPEFGIGPGDGPESPRGPNGQKMRLDPVWDRILLMGSPVDVRRALTEGRDPNHRLSDGWTPLMNASFRGRYDYVTEMLKDSRTHVDATDEKEDTALLLASRAGHYDVVHALLKAGADATLQNRKGETATSATKDKSVRALIEQHLRSKDTLQHVQLQADRCIERKEYQRARDMLHEITGAFPDYYPVWYKLAVIDALDSKAKSSLDNLRTAIRAGFADIDRLDKDVTFNDLRTRDDFHKLRKECSEMREKRDKQGGGALNNSGRMNAKNGGDAAHADDDGDERKGSGDGVDDDGQSNNNSGSRPKMRLPLGLLKKGGKAAELQSVGVAPFKTGSVAAASAEANAKAADLMLEGKYTEAKRVLAIRCNQDSEFAETWFNLARVESALDNVELALKYFKSSLHRGYDNWLLVQDCPELESLRTSERHAAKFAELVQEYRYTPPPWAITGRRRLEQQREGSQDETARDASTAGDLLSPRTMKIKEVNVEAVGLLRKKKYDKARDLLENVLVHRPLHARTHYTLACVESKAGRKIAALDHLEAAFECAARPNFQLLEREAYLEPLRSHPRFKDMVERFKEMARKRAEAEADVAQPPPSADADATKAEAFAADTAKAKRAAAVERAAAAAKAAKAAKAVDDGDEEDREVAKALERGKSVTSSLNTSPSLKRRSALQGRSPIPSAAAVGGVSSTATNYMATPLLGAQQRELERVWFAEDLIARNEDSEARLLLYELLDDAQAQHYRNPLAQFCMAVVEARSGAIPEALVRLQEAVENGFNDISRLRYDSNLDVLRGEARFQKTLIRVQRQYAWLRMPPPNVCESCGSNAPDAKLQHQLTMRVEWLCVDCVTRRINRAKQDIVAEESESLMQRSPRSPRLRARVAANTTPSPTPTRTDTPVKAADMGGSPSLRRRKSGELAAADAAKLEKARSSKKRGVSPSPVSAPADEAGSPLVQGASAENVSSSKGSGAAAAAAQEKKRERDEKAEQAAELARRSNHYAMEALERGDLATARVLLSEVVPMKLPKMERALTLFNMARVEALEGNRARAMEYLDGALRTGKCQWELVMTDPGLNGLQKTQAFKVLIAKHQHRYRDRGGPEGTGDSTTMTQSKEEDEESWTTTLSEETQSGDVRNEQALRARHSPRNSGEPGAGAGGGLSRSMRRRSNTFSVVNQMPRFLEEMRAAAVEQDDVHNVKSPPKSARNAEVYDRDRGAAIVDKRSAKKHHRRGKATDDAAVGKETSEKARSGDTIKSKKGTLPAGFQLHETKATPKKLFDRTDAVLEEEEEEAEAQAAVAIAAAEATGKNANEKDEEKELARRRSSGDEKSKTRRNKTDKEASAKTKLNKSAFDVAKEETARALGMMESASESEDGSEASEKEKEKQQQKKADVGAEGSTSDEEVDEEGDAAADDDGDEDEAASSGGDVREDQGRKWDSVAKGVLGKFLSERVDDDDDGAEDAKKPSDKGRRGKRGVSKAAREEAGNADKEERERKAKEFTDGARRKLEDVGTLRGGRKAARRRAKEAEKAKAAEEERLEKAKSSRSRKKKKKEDEDAAAAAAAAAAELTGDRDASSTEKESDESECSASGVCVCGEPLHFVRTELELAGHCNRAKKDDTFMCWMPDCQKPVHDNRTRLLGHVLREHVDMLRLNDGAIRRLLNETPEEVRDKVSKKKKLRKKKKKSA